MQILDMPNLPSKMAYYCTTWKQVTKQICCPVNNKILNFTFQDMIPRGPMSKMDPRQGVGLGGLSKGHTMHPGYQTQAMFAPHAPRPRTPSDF